MINNIEQRKQELKELQSMSMSQKVQTTIAKILEFWTKTEGNCYLSCSGGADSMVLHDICDRMYQNGIIPTPIKVVFDDTGLEEPTVRATALEIQNIEVVKPEMSFLEVLKTKGYPIISKETSECVVQARKCLDKIRAGAERERTSYLYRLQRFTGTGSYSKDKKTLGNIDQKEFP